MAMLVTAAVTVKISLLAMLARIPSRFHCPCPVLQGAYCPDCGVLSGLGGGRWDRGLHSFEVFVFLYH